MTPIENTLLAPRQQTIHSTESYCCKPSSTENPVSLLSTYYIVQGQTKYHSVYVGTGVKYLEVDLNWGDKSDHLPLASIPLQKANSERTVIVLMEV